MNRKKTGRASCLKHNIIGGKNLGNKFGVFTFIALMHDVAHSGRGIIQRQPDAVNVNRVGWMRNRKHVIADGT